MAKYVNSDELVDKEYSEYGVDPAYYWEDDPKAKMSSYLIESLQSAKGIEIVRCKECEFRCTSTCFAKHETADEDFCSCGRMKNDA